MRSEQPSKRRASNRAARLVNTEPVTFHELYPADQRIEGRVDLMDLHPVSMSPGDEARFDFPIAETRQHAGVPAGLSLQSSLLLPEVQLLDHDGLAEGTGMLHHPGHRIADQGQGFALSWQYE